MAARFRPTLPPETFRIRPQQGSRYYFVVHVGTGLGTMRAAMRRHSGWAHPKMLGAVDSVRHRLPSGRLTGCCGVIYFSRRHIGTGIVAHELAHAAFRLSERLGDRVEHWRWREGGRVTHVDGSATTVPSEERYCVLVEGLSRDFWNKAYATGLVS